MKIRAIVDCFRRPMRFMLTGAHIVQGDKGYDTNAVRSQIAMAWAWSNVPP